MIGFGAPHRHFRECDSTNTRARELADAGAPGGMIVTAEAQTAGRGRHGRSWVAPRGGALLYSALLRPLTQANELLPLAVPVALCDAIEALAPVECRVKWPNDVWIEGRKVAGVLIEARAEAEGGFAVIGIGLNVAIDPGELPAEVAEIAASVGHGATIRGALEQVNDHLGTWLERSAGDVIAAFESRDALAGAPVSWSGSGGGNGTAAGISDRGELRVVLSDGSEELLSAGEVHLGHQDS